MAKDLSRRELHEIIAAYKGGELSGSRSTRSTGGSLNEAFVRNATASLLPSGTPVKISGYAQELTFDAALSRLLNNKLTLRAVDALPDDAPETLASTLEPIRADGLGRVKLDGLLAARVTFPEGGDDYEFASATFVATESGPFRILAKSKLSAERVAVCALAKVAATAPDPFVFDYVERQPSYPTGSYISNRTWRDEYTPNGLKCYLCYCDLYNDKNATLGDLFAKKLKWDVTARDWTGTHLTGLPCETSSGDRTVLTPVCCGIQATILTGSEYKTDDIRTWSYRNGWAPKPPLTGRAFFPFPIFLQFALSWNDAENERMYFRPYNAVVDNAGWPNTETHELCVLDHPRRHFATLDDVPDVFFLPGLRGASIQLLCPVCYVPKQAEYIFDFKTTYETDEAFRFALETRPFKTASGDRYCEKRWEAEGTPPDSARSAVAIGPKSTRFTSKLYTAKSTRPSTPTNFAVSVDGATVSFTWGTRQYAATYLLRIESLAGEIVAGWTLLANAATWTARESGDYVAFLAAADAAGLRSEETSVAFSVVVPVE